MASEALSSGWQSTPEYRRYLRTALVQDFILPQATAMIVVLGAFALLESGIHNPAGAAAATFFVVPFITPIIGLMLGFENGDFGFRVIEAMLVADVAVSLAWVISSLMSGHLCAVLAITIIGLALIMLFGCWVSRDEDDYLSSSYGANRRLVALADASFAVEWLLVFGSITMYALLR